LTARTVGIGLGSILGVFILQAGMAENAMTASNATDPPPAAHLFYSDKFDLLMYLDNAGRNHPVRNVEEWARRREHIVANMELVMGPLPDDTKKVPLGIVEETVEELPGVTRKKITYVSEAGHRVPAYLCIPDNLTGPAPAILCLHGSGGYNGKTAGVGGTRYPAYALEPARRGYVTIAPECPMMGGNQVDPYKMGYVSGSMKAIWDHMRAVDVLRSMPEVDGERIGVIGNSLGGHNSLFVAVFDPRIKAIVCSSGFDSFSDYLNGNLGPWCQKCYMPRIKTVYGKDPNAIPFDFPEVLAALAPRPLFINAPLRDGNFKAASVRKCLEAAIPVYRLFGAESNVKVIQPDAPHGFARDSRKQAYEFLDRVLEKTRAEG